MLALYLLPSRELSIIKVAPLFIPKYSLLNKYIVVLNHHEYPDDNFYTIYMIC